ncbi:hypothetical protein MRX96_025682 [Rhipicephalus microplus]
MKASRRSSAGLEGGAGGGLIGDRLIGGRVDRRVAGVVGRRTGSPVELSGRLASTAAAQERTSGPLSTPPASEDRRENDSDYLAHHIYGEQGPSSGQRADASLPGFLHLATAQTT